MSFDRDGEWSNYLRGAGALATGGSAAYWLSQQPDTFQQGFTNATEWGFALYGLGEALKVKKENEV